MGTSTTVYRNGAPYHPHSADRAWSISARGATFDRFETRPGDTAAGETGKERTELAGKTPMPFDTDLWLSFASRVTTPALDAEWCVLAQFRATDDAGEFADRSPAWTQEFVNGTFRIVTRSDPAAASTGQLSPVVRYSTTSYALSTWHQHVYRLRFARTGNGLLQAWIDGTEVIAESTLPMGFNDTLGPLLKYGIYRAGGSTQTVVSEVANLELGTTSLATRVTSPLPLP